MSSKSSRSSTTKVDSHFRNQKRKKAMGGT